MKKRLIIGRIVLIAGITCIWCKLSGWSATQNTDLYEAANSGDVNLAKKALAEGADINAPNELGGQSAPLIAAANHSPREMVEFLLKNGADPLRTNGNYSAWASTGSNEIRTLLKQAMDAKAFK